MIEKIQNIYKIPELRKKILFTMAIIFVCRVGVHIPLPGIDINALGSYLEKSSQSLFGMFNMFTGGAFSKAAIFALGIMPYISASIILQLLGTVFPIIAKMQKDEDGRKKMTQYTRYATVFLAMAQGYGVSVFLQSMNSSGVVVVPNAGVFFQISTMITLATGTMVLMWLGEQISAKGIGNGVSLIIAVGIFSRFPAAAIEEFINLSKGNREIIVEILLWLAMLGAVAAVIYLTQGQRKLPVHYAKRQVGGRTAGGNVSVIPLRVNMAGVMPIIFAQSILFAPNTIAKLLPEGSAARDFIMRIFDYQSISYMLINVAVIVFFTYFYTAIMYNTNDLSNNLKQGGGFIPGIKPGKDTANYIDSVLSRILFPGSLFLGLIAVMPNIIIRINPGISYNFATFFGGTSLIIIVGVALDTLQQIETTLMMHDYDGFMKTGKITGRR